jgi:enoyl-CoA hydratase
MPDALTLERLDRGIAVLRFERPARLNALSDAIVADLHRLLDGLAHDADLRVLVVTGSGRGFCAGFDLGEAAAAPDEDTVGRAAAWTARQEAFAGLVLKLRALRGAGDRSRQRTGQRWRPGAGAGRRDPLCGAVRALQRRLREGRHDRLRHGRELAAAPLRRALAQLRDPDDGPPGRCCGGRAHRPRHRHGARRGPDGPCAGHRTRDRRERRLRCVDDQARRLANAEAPGLAQAMELENRSQILAQHTGGLQRAAEALLARRRSSA